MKRKRGFTLAEVLITLAVIGIISALTLPTLMADTTAAQIGPKLAKAVASFEQANESFLNSNAVDTLTDSEYFDSVDAYGEELSKYFKITKTNSGYLSKDGMRYEFTKGTAPTNTTDPAYKQKVGEVKIDINGLSKKQVNGANIFYFSWWNDGSLRPKGATNWDEATTSIDGGATHWKTQCKEDETPSDATYCAGHIFENNLKVLYN